MWLFGSLWNRWELAFKVVTPFLHIVFSAAQIWGSINLRSMWLRQKKLLKERQHEEGLYVVAVENRSTINK